MSVISELIRFTLSRPGEGTSTVSLNSRDSYNNEVNPDDGIYREGSSIQIRAEVVVRGKVEFHYARKNQDDDGFNYLNVVEYIARRTLLGLGGMRSSPILNYPMSIQLSS